MSEDKVKIYRSINERDAVAIDVIVGTSNPGGYYCRISCDGLYNDCSRHGLNIIGVDLT